MLYRQMLSLCALLSLILARYSEVESTIFARAGGSKKVPQSEHDIYLIAKDAASLNYASGRINQLPFITLCYAQTLDGSMYVAAHLHLQNIYFCFPPQFYPLNRAPLSKERFDISSEASFRLLHSLRADNDGVMIGVSTLIHDTPRLNVRQPLFKELLTKNPRPIVLDSSLRLLEIDSILLQNPLVFTCIPPTHPRFQAAVEKLNGMGGGEVIHCLANQFGRCDISTCLKVLYDRFGMQKILLEGGAELIRSFLELELIGQTIITIKCCFLGGYRCVSSELSNIVRLLDVSTVTIGDEIILRGLNSYCNRK